ncbi:MAG TPA: CHAT domain-containing protein [Rhodanobacteraceae bacterium]
MAVPPAALSPPFVRDGVLAAGRDARYRIAVPAGDSVDLSLLQLDATLRLRARSDRGATLPMMENDAGRQARTRLTLYAGKAAVWTLDIAASDPKAPAHFRLIAGSPHPTTTVDHLRAKAERALARAENLRREAGSLEYGKHAGASKPATVLAAYQAAIDTARAADDPCLQLRANSDRARYDFAIGRYTQARDSEVAALKFSCGPAGYLAAAAEEAAAQRTLGASLAYLGDFTAAIAAQKRALALYRQTGDRTFQSMALGDLSADYRVIGAMHAAMASARESLALAKQTGNRRRALFARESMAAIRMQRGEWGPARRTYRAVLRGLRATPYPLVEGMSWTDLGQVDWELHDVRLSRRAFAQAVALATKAGDSQGMADTLLDEADIDLEEHRVDAADGIFSRNLGVDVKRGLQREQAHALIGLSRVAIARRAWPAARHDLAQARALAQRVGTVEMEIAADQATGDLDAAERRDPQAAAAYAHAYELAMRYHDDNSRIVMLGNEARIALAEGHAERAEKFIAPAIALIESEQAQVYTPSLRTDYFTSLRAYYGLDIDVLMRLHQEHPGKGYAIRALEVSEEARARALRDRLRARGINVVAHVAPSLLAAERTAEDALRQAAWRQEQLPPNATAAAQQNARHAVDAASRRLEDARARVHAADPRFAELAYPQHFNVAAFQHRLDAGVVAFEYWLGPSQSYRWRITRDSVTARVLPSRATLDRAAAALRASILVPSAAATDTSFAARAGAIAAADQKTQRQAAALGRILLPATSRGQHRTRVVVADGELQWIPFDVLEPDAHINYVYLPSLATLAELREGPAVANAPSLAVFANPVFSLAGARLARHAKTGGPLQLADARLRGALSDVGITALPSLPYSGIEARRLAALVPADARWIATGFAASRANALAVNWSRYRFVDFATHSLIDQRHPELSGVVLSLYNAKGGFEDGILRMQDIYGLRMPVAVVTLNVCDSALAPGSGSGGSFGLSGAFFYAGVHDVVVSLWPVDDRASAKLMTLFYRHLIDQHESPQAALQAAQAQMRSDPRWRSPFYWAGFEIQGDWQ